MKVLKRILHILFPLPSVENRVLRGGYADKMGAKDIKGLNTPGVYIGYLAMRGFFYIAFTGCALAFVVSCAHRYFDQFAFLSYLYGGTPKVGPELLGIYIEFLKWVRSALLLVLMYFLLFYAQYIDFRKYHPLYYWRKTSTKDFTRKESLSITFLGLSMYFMTMMFPLGLGFFYSYPSLWITSYDSVLFVALLVPCMAFTSCFIFYFSYLLILLGLYAIYERLPNSIKNTK